MSGQSARQVRTMSGAEAAATFRKSGSEDDLLTAIVEAALFLGWQVFHVRRSDKALTMGTPGFPDLCLAKNGRVEFWELKSERGNLTPDQFKWQLAIGSGAGEEVGYAVIRPADLDAALAELARP